MATASKPQQSTTPATPRPAATPRSKQVSQDNKPQGDFTLLFGKENYILAILGVVLIFVGFMLMSGGKSDNPHEFHYDEIFSFRRITLAPIVIFLGYAVEIFAIMRKPKETAQ